MPSRCIFFLSALRAWSTLLSRTRTCKRKFLLAQGPDRARTVQCKNWVPANECRSEADESLPRSGANSRTGQESPPIGGYFGAGPFRQLAEPHGPQSKPQG